jgi:hypothetical protein
MHQFKLGAVLLLLVFTTCSQPPNNADSLNKEEQIIYSVEESNINNGINYKHIEEKVLVSLARQKYNKRINIMAAEIKNYWVNYYNKKEYPINKLQKYRFNRFSKSLAKTVYYFQNNNTDLGGRLPKDRYTHLFLAMMIAKETAVDPTVRGKTRKEVGLIQIHGAALMRYTPQEVLDNPELGIYLGTRWLTSKFNTCRKNMKKEWNNLYWQYPISIYAAGEGNGRAYKGKCKSISIGRDRTVSVLKYIKNID